MFCHINLVISVSLTDNSFIVKRSLSAVRLSEVSAKWGFQPFESPRSVPAPAASFVHFIIIQTVACFPS